MVQEITKRKSAVDDLLGLGKEYIQSATGKPSSTLDDIKDSIELTEKAVHRLHDSVITAFDIHDHNLRVEVEKIGSKVTWLLSVVVLVGAALLAWPRNKNT